jgi:hypothetical protein
MAETPTQDESIAALDALSADTAEQQETITDPIVEAAKAPAEKEPRIDPPAGDVPRPIVSPSRTAPTRLDMAEKGLDRAKQGVKEAQRELSDAARAAAEGAPRQLTLVELNAIAKRQQAPEAAQRRKVHELISEFGLMRRPHQTHSVVAPLPNTEAKVEE